MAATTTIVPDDLASSSLVRICEKLSGEADLAQFSMEIDDLVKSMQARPFHDPEELRKFASKIGGVKQHLKTEAKRLGLDYCFEITKGLRRYNDLKEIESEQRKQQKLADDATNSPNN